MVFLLALFSGLGVFAVLIGFVNETVTSTIDGINEGQSKIAESGHTLILGWNEFHTSQLPAIVSLLVHTWPDGSIAPGPRLNEPSPDTADIFCNLRGSIIFSIQYFRLEPEGYRDCSVADKSSLYSLCINCITRNISFFFAVFFSLSLIAFEHLQRDGRGTPADLPRQVHRARRLPYRVPPPGTLEGE